MNLTMDRGTRKITDEGFLIVEALAARTGVQAYLASEINVDPVDDTGIVYVARLNNDVFSKDSLDSWNTADVTNDHPDGAVTADNYKQTTVGHVMTQAEKMGDHVKVGLIIKDKQTIELINKGKKQLSAGYTADYVRESGVLDGHKYDYVQKNIKINHVAVVNSGRAGSAIILDTGENLMELEQAQAKIAELEATVAELSKRPTYDSLNDLIKVREDARKINPTVELNGSAEEIKRAALAGKVTLDNYSDDVVKYVFEQELAKMQEVTTTVTKDAAINVSAVVSGGRKAGLDTYINSLSNYGE